MDLPQQPDLFKAISDKWNLSADSNSLSKEFFCHSSEETTSFMLALLQMHCEVVLIDVTPNYTAGTVVVRTTGKTHHPNSVKWIDSLEAIQNCYDKTHRKFNKSTTFTFFRY